MIKCRNCKNRLRFWKVKCPLCSGTNWQFPQVALVICIAILSVSLYFLALDYVVVNDVQTLDKKAMYDDTSQPRPNSPPRIATPAKRIVTEAMKAERKARRLRNGK